MEFDEWALEHGRSYATEEERNARRKIFEENSDLVAWLNEQHRSE